MRRAEILKNLIFVLAAPVAVQAGPHGRQVAIKGTVDHATVDSIGRTDGIVLKDHTVIGFTASALAYGVIFNPGDAVSVNGTQYLDKPNRALVRVIIRKGGHEAVDDAAAVRTKAATESTPDAPQADAKLVYRGGGKFMGAGVDLDGHVDRVVLEDGVTIHIPNSAELNLAALTPGATLHVIGASTALSDLRFVVAMSLVDENMHELLKPRHEKNGSWQIMHGTIKEIVKEPNEDVSGFTLAEGKTVRFSPMFRLGQASRFTPGTAVEVAGPVVDQDVYSEMVILTAENAIVDTSVAYVGRRGGTGATSKGVRVPGHRH